jgi:hypothetical protein
MQKFRCRHCQQKITAPEEYIGKRVRCPRCKQPVRVPAPDPPAEVPPPLVSEPVESHSHDPASPVTEPMIDFGQPPEGESVREPVAQQAPSALFGDWVPREESVAETGQGQIVAPSHDPHNHQESPPNEPYDYEETPPQDVADFVVPPSEVIDAPAARPKAALDSAAEVADLMRTFEGPQPTQVAADHFVSLPVETQRVPAKSSIESSQNRAIAWTSIVIGVVAIGMSVLPALSAFAIPVGTAGLLLGLGAVFFARGYRIGQIGVSLGGAAASALGIIAAILVANNILPVGARQRLLRAGMTPTVKLEMAGGATSQPVDSGLPEYIPATSPLLLNNVELRIVSVKVLRPAVYSGEYNSLHTIDQRRVQIALEVRNVGSNPVTYQPYRRTEADSDEEAKLSEAAGDPLMFELAAARPGLPASLPFGAMRGPAALSPGGDAASDVLLFEPPGNLNQDLNLDLPGANLGVPGLTLHIRIPAMMIQS